MAHHPFEVSDGQFCRRLIFDARDTDFACSAPEARSLLAAAETIAINGDPSLERAATSSCRRQSRCLQASALGAPVRCGAIDKGRWVLQAALGNGSSGGAENNRDKQLSLRAEQLLAGWRWDGSLNSNAGSGDGERNMFNLFAGARWLEMEWLAEADWINGKGTSVGSIDRVASLFEVNRLIKPGHNLKFTLELYDPDRGVRIAAGCEFSRLTEARCGQVSPRKQKPRSGFRAARKLRP